MKIAVYCGASTGNHVSYANGALDLADWITNHRFELVYGGGRAGLMGVIADKVLANGGKATGVIPAFLQDRELAHPGLTQLIVVNNMHERKQLTRWFKTDFSQLRIEKNIDLRFPG